MPRLHAYRDIIAAAHLKLSFRTSRSQWLGVTRQNGLAVSGVVRPIYTPFKMATWRSTTLAAAALVLLAGVQTVVCIDDLCNVTEAITCYWSQARDYGVKVLKPKPEDFDEFLKNVCVPTLPEDSKCSDYYKSCSEEQKDFFIDQEHGYKQLRDRVTDPVLCEEVHKLLGCIDKNTVLYCPVEFADEYTPENAKKNNQSAMGLSRCISKALKPCTEKAQTAIKEYLGEIAKAVTKLYKYKALPPTPAPPTEPTTTEASTTKLPVSTTIAPTAPTTEPTTVVPTTPEPTTQPPTTQETTTYQPSTLPPTTPAPPSGAPSMHAVGALGFVALALLARGV